jgi:hypothetical protein
MSESLLDHAAIANRTRQAYEALGVRPPEQIFNDKGDDLLDEVFAFVRHNEISFDWLVLGDVCVYRR